MRELTHFLVSPLSSIREVMRCIDANAQGIALVVDAAGHLIGTVTDGDLRRAILANLDLASPITLLLNHPVHSFHRAPLTAPAGTPDDQLLRLMTEHSMRQIPLVDETSRVIGISLLSELIKEFELPLTALVMAGGFGSRLHPLTEQLPKPMLPVGGRPLLEVTIQRLQAAGIRRVSLATHYKSDVIAKHFGDGHEFGVEIQYIKEDQPLGTAGALGLINASDEPLLVINGDILTQVDYRSMLHFHREHQARMTVGVRQYEINIPYGVIETDGVFVHSVAEKPMARYLINAGIYLLDQTVARFVPSAQPYAMTDLINRLLAEGEKVVSFPVREYWLDIGQMSDYDQANNDVAVERQTAGA